MKRIMNLLLSTACVLASVVQAQAGTPEPPKNLSATWSMEGSSVVNLKWDPPANRPTGITLYAIYATQGDATAETNPPWRKISVTSLTTATVDMQVLGLTSAATMSFEVYTRVVSLTDTLQSAASAIAVATWKATGKDTLIFVSRPLLNATVGIAYKYEARAVHIGAQGSGDVSYSLVASPDSMRIDASSGMVTWTPAAKGTVDVVIVAMSKTGESTRQQFSITVAGGLGLITGTVTDSATGTAVANAIVTFFKSNAQLRADFEAITDANGNFSARLLEGDYIVHADARGYLAVYWESATSSALAKTITITSGDTLKLAVNFKLAKQPQANCIVNILDDSGHAINGATVTAILKGRLLGIIGDVFPEYGEQFSAKTNAQGVATLQLSPGTYLIRADADGRVSAWFDAESDLGLAKIVQLRGNDTVTITFRLHEKERNLFCTIKGNVSGLDSAGKKPLAFARVNFLMVHSKKVDDDSDVDSWTISTLTNGDGNYTIMLPCKRTYIAYAWAQGYVSQYFSGKKTPQEADRIALDTDLAGIDFMLSPVKPYRSHIDGRVISCDSLNMSLRARVTVFLSIDGHFRPVETTMTDSTGAYAFENLAAGSYIIHAISLRRGYVPGYYTGIHDCTRDWHRAKAVVIADGSIQNNLDVYVPPARRHRGFITISGSVTVLVDATTTTQLSGATVLALDAAGNVVASATTEIDGSFEMNGVDVGAYTMTIDKVGFSTLSEKQVNTDYDGNSSPSVAIPAAPDAPSAVSSTPIGVPAGVVLAQSYPNPVNANSGTPAMIEYTIDHRSPVTLEIYSIGGARVARLVWGVFEAGTHSVPFTPGTLPAGVYFYRLRAGDVVITKQLRITR